MLALLVLALAARSGAGDQPAPGVNLPLDGEWAFALLPDTTRDSLSVSTGRDYHLAQAYIRASNSSIQVPGSWDAQGFGNETDRMRHEWLGRGAYQRRVELPATLTTALARDGARAWLVIQRPKRSVEVFVASRFIGSHLGYLDNLELDVTDYLHGSDPAIFDCMLIVDGGWGNVNVPPLGSCPWAGTSEAPACKLPAAGPAQAGAPNERDQLVGADCTALRDGSPGDWGGFHGHIQLVVRNRVGLSAPGSLQITTPGVPPDGRVGVHVTPTDGSQTKPGDSASFEIRAAGNDSVVARGTAVASADGTFNISARVTAESLVLWDLETPQLYVVTVTVHDQAGHVLAEVNESFGFRSFSTSGMSFLLNGEPIFLSGYGDDSIFPLTYAPPTERTWYDKKFRLAKQVSAAIVSHDACSAYPLSTDLLLVTCAVGLHLRPIPLSLFARRMLRCGRCGRNVAASVTAGGVLTLLLRTTHEWGRRAWRGHRGRPRAATADVERFSDSRAQPSERHQLQHGKRGVLCSASHAQATEPHLG